MPRKRASNRAVSRTPAARAQSSKGAPPALEHRIAKLDWQALEAALWHDGYAHTRGLLTPAECKQVVALYPREELFRSRVDMSRLRFGVGEYKYFARPLPDLIEELRQRLYACLAPVATRMAEALANETTFPDTLDDYLARCRRAGQTRATPLLLRYTTGGYNRLHRDLYGDLVFPLQVTIALSRAGRDYRGGAFLLLEDRAREQARAEAIELDQGEMLIFPVRERPARGVRGIVRATMRHGVSRLLSGERFALGIIFHDAK